MMGKEGVLEKKRSAGEIEFCADYFCVEKESPNGGDWGGSKAV
jgi:hypothetical protein